MESIISEIKYVTESTKHGEGYRRGLGIPNRSSVTDMYGSTFKEAKDLFIRQQLCNFRRVCHSDNDIVSNFPIQPEAQEQNQIWNCIVIPGRRNIMPMSYREYKSWLNQ